MTTPKGIPAVGMNLLPRIYNEPAPNASGVTYMRPIDVAQERSRQMRKAGGIFKDEDLALMIKPLDTILEEEDPRAQKILISRILGHERAGRVNFWDNDLSHPGKKAIFTNEVKRNLPWLHEVSEAWETDEQSNLAFQASRELAATINNWATAAVNNAGVMKTLMDLAQDPAITAAIFPAMKAMAEAGNKAVYSVLLGFAGTGLPDALEQAKIFVLATRLNVDANRHGWMDHLGLILATRHLDHFEPVKVSSTTEKLQNPEANPIPLRIAKDLVEKFDDLGGMEGIVHEALRRAHEYFEYFYNDDNDAAEMDRLKGILIALASTESKKLEPISDDDFKFLANSLTLPVPTMLMSIAYHGQANPAYFETLESFADRGSWEMFADDILQVFEGTL